ncbi:autotransporter outer membrane beta-barrel domain-containing protein, partial [Salmonella enterica subsp. enterica serovar Typhimurium]|nr:autotransporter outer membrane beta-barrel domain-containing protein [Salmonella enterica subsp. enterica serovar Typhimurium]
MGITILAALAVIEGLHLQVARHPLVAHVRADTDSTGNRGADGSQFTSSGNVDGYNLGVYATWFADAQT